MIGRVARVIVVAAGLAMAASTPAFAQAPPPAVARGRLLLTVRAPSGEEAPIVDVISDAARRRDLDVTFDPGAGSVLRVDIDAEAAVPSVTVIDLRDDVVLTRRQVPRAGSSEVLREELALVVASAIDAARVRTPTPRAPPPPPPPATDAPPPRPPPPPAPTGAPSPVRWSGLGFAELRAPHGTQLVPGLGVGLRGALASTWHRPSLSLLAAWHSPSGVDGDEVDLHVTGAAVRALVGVDLVDGETVALAASLGPSLSFDRFAARSRVPDVDVRAPTNTVTPLATALFDGAWKLGHDNALTLSVGADMPLSRRRVALATPGGNEGLLTPARVQPFAMLSIVFSLGGAR